MKYRLTLRGRAGKSQRRPAAGVIWVYGANDDDGILAFADNGIEEIDLPRRDGGDESRSPLKRNNAPD
ncbi:MAG: hypothetical protein E5V89_04055 [Mesorhizobium sp.]|nr:MAG: hypothetical protein EOS36_04525 [Mesorhizobium sp.]RWE50892.1 MAG: hypothetical protein EOS79_03700 [Mesorhizobium sp.]TIV72698.1 MAG: hypothetical protein E5V89_04055 [Mesorhizobium sp.]